MRQIYSRCYYIHFSILFMKLTTKNFSHINYSWQDTRKNMYKLCFTGTFPGLLWGFMIGQVTEQQITPSQNGVLPYSVILTVSGFNLYQLLKYNFYGKVLWSRSKLPIEMTDDLLPDIILQNVKNNTKWHCCNTPKTSILT